jgi:PadR family transcriptional regulator
MTYVGGMHGRHGARGHRSRRRIGPGEWAVRARIERFHEPALLLLLRERPRHGYELIELLPAATGGERVDVGNLYRFLRRLESEGIVESEWNGDLPGPAKRTYSLTAPGERLLGQWADALRQSREDVSAFLDRYEKGGE